MAIDTEQKRRAVLRVLLKPDAVVSAADRRQVLGVYPFEDSFPYEPPATVEETPSLTSTTADNQGFSDYYAKTCFVQIPIADFSGEYYGAVLDIDFSGDVLAASIGISVYAANGLTWNGSTNYTTLEAMSLGTALETFTATAGNTYTKSYNISDLVQDAITNEETYITVAIRWNGFAGTLDSVVPDLYVGNEYDSEGWILAPSITYGYTPAETGTEVALCAGWVV